MPVSGCFAAAALEKEVIIVRKKVRKNISGVIIGVLCVALCVLACACGETKQNSTAEKAKSSGVAGRWYVESEGITVDFLNDGTYVNENLPDSGSYVSKYAFETIIVADYEEDGYASTEVLLINVDGDRLELDDGRGHSVVYKRTGSSGEKGGFAGEWYCEAEGTKLVLTGDGKYNTTEDGETLRTGTYKLKEILSMLFYNTDGTLIDRDSMFYEVNGDTMTCYRIGEDGNPIKENTMTLTRVK